MAGADTKAQIIRAARDLLAQDGLSALSFDAIARRLGRTKQAILYWFPTKQDLLAALFLPWLEEEADRVVTALGKEARGDAAVALFVRGLLDFHLEDLDRFRMMYLVPQTLRGGKAGAGTDALLDRIHPVTDRIYSSLAERLPGPPEEARQRAFVIHSACLGLLLMEGLAQSIGDPLKHEVPALAEGLISSLTAKPV